MRVLMALILLVCGAAPAAAKPQTCETSIHGTAISAGFDSKDNVLRENRSYRERLFGGYGRITCPGYVTLRAMTAGLTDPQRDPFCLQYDAARKTYTGFVVGERDAYVGCRRPSKSLCEHVAATKDTALTVARFAADIAAGQRSGGPSDSLSSVTDASGAFILSGPARYLRDGLIAVGADALSAITAPGTLTAAAVTVVAVGGAVYICQE